MLSNIEYNNKLIEQISQLLNSNRIDTNAALNVLYNNNKALSYFVDSVGTNHCSAELLLRVYGLLQILFVSIDSLYTLSLSTTKSKNFISLNDNKELRELKYIRNDVIGHPTNRIVENHIEYSILKTENIKEDSLSYSIYYDGEETKREVDLLKLINVYYDESNHFLESLIDFKKSLVTAELSDDIYEAYNIFVEKADIYVNLKAIKQSYLKKSNSGRILKKINLLINLHKEYEKNKNYDLYYVISYHLKNLYQTVSTEEGEEFFKLKLPKLPGSLMKIKKVLAKRSDLQDLVYHLYDINHPLFYKSLARLTMEFKNNEFMHKINLYVSQDNKAFVYAYSALLKEIAKLSC